MNRYAMSEIQLVVFDLASEHYGVEISEVREIILMQSVIKVPGVKSCVDSIINRRGKVLPVLDLRKRLGMKVADQTDESRIVVIDIGGSAVGVIVDAVTEVLHVPDSAIELPSSMSTQGNSGYLRGIAKLPGRLIILLDINKLLSSRVDSEAIASVMEDSCAGSRNDVSDERMTESKKKNDETVHNNNNNKEYAAV